VLPYYPKGQGNLILLEVDPLAAIKYNISDRIYIIAVAHPFGELH
jgi:hypothetical protein